MKLQARECELLAGKKLAIVQGSHDPFKIRHVHALEVVWQCNNRREMQS